MPWWVESRGIQLSSCLSVCVILQRAFLRDGNKLSYESCNATTTLHSTTTKSAKFLL